MHALGLFRERPAHLRRLSGVAKVSLDNRFTRRVVVSPSPPPARSLAPPRRFMRPSLTG